MAAHRRLGIEAAVHLPESARKQYLTYYRFVNPWSRASIERGLLFKAVRGVDLVSELTFRQSEFYYDFVRPLDTVEAMGCAIPLGPGQFWEVGVHRSGRLKRLDHSHNRQLLSIRQIEHQSLCLRIAVTFVQRDTGQSGSELEIIGKKVGGSSDVERRCE